MLIWLSNCYDSLIRLIIAVEARDGFRA